MKTKNEIIKREKNRRKVRITCHKNVSGKRVSIELESTFSTMSES